MPCISPLTVDAKRINGVHTENRRYDVPCGRCADCLNRRVNDWKFRLVHEERSSLTCMFITLTYANHTVPVTKTGKMTLDKPRWDNPDDIRIIKRGKNRGKRKLRDDHITAFFKRLRIIQSRDKKISKEWRKLKISYYACSEYGELYQRPHHHCIIFNVANPEYIGKAWRHGLVDVQLRPKTGAFAYTAGYIMKGKSVTEGDDRVPEFSRMSKGIGESYITPESVKHHKESIYLNNYVVLDGLKQPMPRYYKSKIYNEIERKELAEYAQYLSEMEWDDLHSREGSLIFDILNQRKLSKIARLKSKNSIIKRSKDGTEKFEVVRNTPKLRSNKRR